MTSGNDKGSTSSSVQSKLNSLPLAFNQWCAEKQQDADAGAVAQSVHHRRRFLAAAEVLPFILSINNDSE
jgi:hypothetical protein